MPPHPRLLPGPFTVEMYHRLGELGIFGEDDRVELLDGQIVAMTPIGRRHAACVTRLNYLLSRRSGADIAVSVQNPVPLGQRWEPQPDIVVVRRPGGFGGAWLPAPADIVLLVEVADSSLERDRDVKIPRYAAAGVPETWLVDLDAETVTVYRDPRPNGYGTSVTARRGDSLRPAGLDEVVLTAEEILA